MNKAFVLKSRPIGRPDVLNFEETSVLTEPLQSGQILLEGKYFSVDPYMRGRMCEDKSYIPPFEVGQPIEGIAIAKVVESLDDDYHAGDYVMGMLKWQQLQIAWGADVQRIDTTVASPSLYLGMLGMPGLTAYFGLTRIGKPKPAETIVVSAAAGAVGMVVGQIGRMLDCNVIGIAGSDEKLSVLRNDLDFNAAISYRDLDKMEEELREAAPLGVDIYFDNVGGPVSDRVLKFINHGSRIVLCGQIALYNNTEVATGPYPQLQLLTHSAMMKGFIVTDFKEQFHDGTIQLLKWYKDGLLRPMETVVHGFDKLPEAFVELFEGRNIGKMVVQVD